MTDLRKAAEMALEALEELRFANAPFLDEAMEALRRALAQQGKECIYPECETGIGCDGPCGAAVKQEPVAWEVEIEIINYQGQSELRTILAYRPDPVMTPECRWKVEKVIKSTPLYAQPVDTVNISQERVDETAKRGHEPVAWHEPDSFGNVTTYKKWALENGWQPLYAAPPKREWVGLTDEAIWLEYQTLWPFHPHEEPRLAKDIAKFARAIEAKLKEKNT